MKILYLAHRLPYPPNKGEKIRTFHQIQQLAKNHTIHLCSFVDDPDDLPHVSALRQYCASVEVIYRSQAPTVFLAAAAFLRRSPFSVSLFYRKALAEKVLQKAARERFDCIIVSSSSMAQYAYQVPDIPKILDFIDVDSEKWRLYAQHHSFLRSFVYRLEAQRLARYEETIARVFDHSIFSSEAESRLFQARASGRPVSAISNGVDLDHFAPSPIDSLAASRPTVVFTGVMDYFPNVDAVAYFCRDIFPVVRRTVPDARFYIVGRNPTRQVRDLGKQTNVMVTGAVPDVRLYLAQARVAVAPVRLACGVQNKILEAMAMGVPVVGTAETFKGIAASEQDGVRIAGDSLSFARQVTTLLRDAAFSREAGLQARRYVERHHRWEDQGVKLEALLEEVVWRRADTLPLGIKSAAALA